MKKNFWIYGFVLLSGSTLFGALTGIFGCNQKMTPVTANSNNGSTGRAHANGLAPGAIPCVGGIVDPCGCLPPEGDTPVDCPSPVPTPTPNVNLILGSNPNQVFPLNAGSNLFSITTINAFVEDSAGNGVSGIVVNFKVISGQGGGHQHGGSRPLGTLSSSSGTTDSNGSCSAVYKAGEVGGSEIIEAFLSNESVTQTIQIKIAVPNLFTMPVGGGFVEFNDPNRSPLHPSNHLAQGQAGNDLFNGLETVGLAVGTVMVVNDVSLENGGLFDISGQWLPPHNSHRKGIDADIENLQDYLNNTAVFDFLMNVFGWRFVDEGQNSGSTAFPHFRYFKGV